MATVEELTDQIYEILGENTTFYTRDELIVNGINPAQRLLCLLRPDLLVQRVTVTLIPGELFIDLRQEAPRAWDIRRVVVGDVSGDAAVRSNGKLYDLRTITPQQLMRDRGWWRATDDMEYYWRHGRHWLVVYPGPVQTSTLTLVFRAMPTAFLTGAVDLARQPDLAASWHSAIAKLAAALLLIKEGVVEIEKALRMLSDVIGEEPLTLIRREMERFRRDDAAVIA